MTATAESPRKAPKRNRIQLDLSAEQAAVLDLMETKLGARTRSDLLQEAIGMLLWYVQENLKGRKVVSIDPVEMGKLQHVVELARPVATLSTADMYDYLVARPHPWRRQLSLKGRNITVGQLIANMTVEDMTPEQAVEQFELPLAQIREAIAYYEANKGLVEAEFREEKRRLQDKGYARELAPLPG